MLRVKKCQRWADEINVFVNPRKKGIKCQQLKKKIKEEKCCMRIESNKLSLHLMSIEKSSQGAKPK